MKATFQMIEDKVTVNLHGRMVASTLETGEMEKSMVLVN